MVSEFLDTAYVKRDDRAFKNEEAKAIDGTCRLIEKEDEGKKQVWLVYIEAKNNPPRHTLLAVRRRRGDILIITDEYVTAVLYDYPEEGSARPIRVKRKNGQLLIEK